MKIMAIDYGDSRTGVAISDITGSIVGETLVIQAYNQEAVISALLPVINSSGVERIIVGYPKNMNGSLGPRAEKSSSLASALHEACGLDIILWDERLTTVDAHKILSDAGKRGKKRKNTVDAVAASLILEGYLASLG